MKIFCGSARKKTDVTRSAIATRFVVVTQRIKRRILLYTKFFFQMLQIVLFCFPSGFRSCDVIRKKFNKPTTAKEVSLSNRVLVAHVFNIFFSIRITINFTIVESHTIFISYS